MRVIRSLSSVLLLVFSIPAVGEQPSPRESVASLLAQSGFAPEWGTADIVWVQLPAVAFLPHTSNSYASDLVTGFRRPLNNGAYFSAPIALPDGAKVVAFGIFYVDNNPSFSIRGSLVECDSMGGCDLHPSPGQGTPGCILDGSVCSGNAFASPSVAAVFGLVESANIVINNLSGRYHLRILVPAADDLMEIASAVVGYRLQVSPAPATATFPNDVPTTHPYFRFIEALADAGITAGCGPGSYCPNNPITRGEMAVFLATALGLHWAPTLF
jgi:hypothetical protein